MVPAPLQAPPTTGVPEVPVPVIQMPPEQVKPATDDEPVHAVPTAGVIQVAPLQYSDPDVLPGELHADPAVGVPPAPVAVAQKPAEQLNPATVTEPAQAAPIAGVTEVVPLQYRDSVVVPGAVQGPPWTAPVVPPPIVGTQNPPLQVRAPAVAVPVQGVSIDGVIQVEPLQYIDPDTLPMPVHAPPAVPVPPVPVLAAQKPLVQVKAPAVAAPVQAPPIAGVIQVVPLQ